MVSIFYKKITLLNMKSNLFQNDAFDDKVPDIQLLHDMEVIDLTGTSINEINIENFPKLQRIRACQCRDLTKCKIHNCPNLKVIDLSNCIELSEIDLSQLSNLLSIDLSMTSLSTLDNIQLPNLESLIASFTKISSLNPSNFPNLLNLDISGTQFTNISFILKLKHLQRFRFISLSPNFLPSTEIEFNFNEILTHPTLMSFIAGPGSAICDSLPDSNISLQLLILEEVDFIKGDSLDLQKKVNYFYDKYSYDVPLFDSKNFYQKQRWTDSVRLLYGPWGIPSCDKTQKITKIGTNDHLKNIDINIAIDRMMGAIFGAAIGSILGSSTIFSDKKLTSLVLETPIDIIWSHLNDDQNTIQFLKGTVSTEIERLVLLLRSINESNQAPLEEEMNTTILRTFALMLHIWSSDGISEHKQGTCLKDDTSLQNTFRHPLFLMDPLRAAFESCSEFITNGTATVSSAPAAGCYKFWDENEVKKNAKEFCSVTHYEGRCIACTVLLSLLISKNIQNEALNIDELIDKTFEFCKEDSEEFENEIKEFLTAESFEELVIGEGAVDFVLKSTGAAVLALRKGFDFEQTMFEIIREGGDTCVNAATAGAVIGSNVGFSKIPKNLMKYLFNGSWIYKEFQQFLAIMGIDPPESPFDVLSYE